MIYFAPDLHCATGLLGEPVYLAQTESGPFTDFLGCVEGLKGAQKHSLIHSTSGIGNRHCDIIAGGEISGVAFVSSDVFGSDRQPPRAVHCVTGIEGEVQDRSLELCWIYTTRPGIGLQSTVDLDAFANSPLTQEQGFAQDVVSPDGLWSDLLAKRERQQVLR